MHFIKYFSLDQNYIYHIEHTCTAAMPTEHTQTTSTLLSIYNKNLLAMIERADPTME